MKKAEARLTVLAREHRVGLDKMALLQAVEDDLAARDLTAAREKLREVLVFADGALKRHFEQEERVLFPALEVPLVGPGPVEVRGEVPDFCGFPFCDEPCSTVGPLAIYRRDHERIYAAIEKLRDAAGQLGAADPDDEICHTAQLAALELSWLLQYHIGKEEAVVIPKAEEVLSRRLIAKLNRETPMSAAARASSSLSVGTSETTSTPATAPARASSRRTRSRSSGRSTS